MQKMTMQYLKSINAKEGRKMIVIGCNHGWGADTNAHKAYKNACSPKRFILFDCHEKVWVSKMDGSLHLDSEDNPNNLTDDQAFVEIGRNF